MAAKTKSSPGRFARPAKAPRAKVAPPYRVFVSHATKDKWIATAICEKLKALGIETFRDDRDIAGGDSIPDRIRDEIRKAREMIVILSPASQNSTWVKLEIGAAWGRRRGYHITVILCHVEVDGIPKMLEPKKAISINDVDRFCTEVGTRMKGK